MQSKTEPMLVVRERSEGNPARDQRYDALLYGLAQGYDKYPQMPSGEAWPQPEQADAFERGARMSHAMTEMIRAGENLNDDLLDLKREIPEHRAASIAAHRQAFLAARNRTIELVRFRGRTIAETYPSEKGKANPYHDPHSPGPWKVQERMTVLEVRGAQNIVDAGYRQVASTAQSEVRNPERLANANLMAAAPELKDVVTMFLLNVSSSSVVEEWVEEHMPQTLDAARAILEKIGEPVPTLREIKLRAR